MPTITYTRADGRVELTPIRVNGAAIPCPASIDIGESDLHKNTERNASGYLVADRVRLNVVKLELKWNFLLPEDYAALKAAVSGSMFFTVEYIDENDALKAKTMYKGDLTRSVSRILATGKIQGYVNVALSLIER